MVLGIAAVQGFVLALIIYFNKRGIKIANQVLGLLLFCFSLILVEESLELLDYHLSYSRITGAGFFLDIILGPLSYLYALAITDKTKVSRNNIAHIVPPLILNLVYIPYHFLISWDNHLINNGNLSIPFGGIVVAKIVFQLIYQIAAIKTVKDFIRSSDKKQMASPQFRAAVWLRKVITAVIILIPVVLMFENLQEIFIYDSDYITSLIMLIAIYSIGYAALSNPIVFSRQTDEVVITDGTNRNDQKYRTSPLTATKKMELKAQLLSYMEAEKPYLNTDLGFDDLAQNLNVPGHHLSQVLNEVLDQKFYDFINSYRIQEVIRKIRNNEHVNNNILTLGLASGFNSKPTLNRAFKKHTGSTPIDYIRNIETR